MSFMNAGPQSMLKDGAQFVDEPIVKNIQASKEIAKITRSSMGPYGLCKLVINHLNKMLVTHDAATIMNELEVEHPAAKLLVMASKAMDDEVGDGTNLVVALAGEFLGQAEGLVRMGLHTSDIIEGYTKAGAKALELLDAMVTSTINDVLVAEQVLPPVRTAIMSKQYGQHEFLADLVVKACIAACPSNPHNFNVDNVRCAKLDGGSTLDSKLVHGFVITRDTEGTIKHVKDGKVALYNCAIDVPSTETKGTALIENAEQLLNYSKKEEEVMDKLVGDIAKVGVKVIVSNANFGDLALHFLERHGIMGVKVASKFEMRRLGVAVNAKTLAKLDAPTLEDVGHVDSVDVENMGGKNLVVFRQDKDDSKLSTIVVRGATQNAMDDVERAINDGINVYKALGKDGRLAAGAGAMEMELNKELMSLGEATPGLDQYAIRKYAASFEVIARTLAEVSGHNGTDAVTNVQAAHQQGKKHAGVDIETGGVIDAAEAGIIDCMVAKFWAIKLATEAAVTVLQVDQIIIAKQAGGPKMKPDGARDDE